MAIARTVKEYLDQLAVPYDVILHSRSQTNCESARYSKVAAECVAKPVVLEDDDGYVMAVIPASDRVRLPVLSRLLQRPLHFAKEVELGALFQDCHLGALPPIGHVYGIETVCDVDLSRKSDVYFEAGDHEELIHVKGKDFPTLMRGARMAHFAEPAGDSDTPYSKTWDSEP